MVFYFFLQLKLGRNGVVYGQLSCVVVDIFESSLQTGES